MILRHTLPVAALLVLAACGDKSATPASDTASTTTAAAASSGSGDAADVGSYRLEMSKLEKFFEAQENMLMRAEKMTPAERQAMQQRTEARNDADASIDDLAKQVESEPVMIESIQSAGLSAREFALITVSMMQTAMASSLAASQPNANQDSLVRAMQANPDNVKFWRANEAAIMQRSTALQERGKKLEESTGK